MGLLATVPGVIRCGRDDTQLVDLLDDDPARARPPLPHTEPRMRVRVLMVDGDDATTPLGRKRQWLRVGVTDDEAVQVVLRAPLQVRLGDQRWIITDAKDVEMSPGGLETLEVAALDDEDADIAIGRREYPGTLRLVARADRESGGFDVINIVGMESYLPGVVAGELFSHWKMQTRWAQAIAARSFAASEHAWFGNRRGYDVTATARSQVYRGSVDHGPSRQAVKMTRGIMLAYEGRLVPGYYSSCCGGTSADALDVIGSNPVNDVSPLRGRGGEDVCTAVKVARWTIERPLDVLTGRLAAYGKRHGLGGLEDLTRLAAIDAVAANPHGRPTRYAITGADGDRVELSAERLRAAVNYRGGGLAAPNRLLLSSHVSVRIDDSSALFEGRGFGHGAGLCQYGAETLARAGKDYREILAWYYPGADLTKAY